MDGTSKKIFRCFLAALILAAALWLGFILSGRTLCRIAIGQIGEMTGTEIKVESINFHTNGSVLIKNLVISPYKEQTGDNFILKAETVWGRFGLGSLLLFRPRLKVITVTDFLFKAQCDLDTGLWNISALKIKVPEGGTGKMPMVSLDGGTLQYSKISNGQAKIAASVPLNARFGYHTQTQDGYSFEITTARLTRSSGKSRLTGYWRPGVITIAGGISSTDIPAFETAWAIDVLSGELKYESDRTFLLKLRIKDLQTKRSPSLSGFAMVSPSFLEKSGPLTALQGFFDRYKPSGQIDLDLNVSGNLNQPGESEVSGRVYCKDVSIFYYRFPYLVEHLTGQVDFTNNNVALNNLVGSHSDTRIFFNGWMKDFGPDWKCQVRITSNNMALDDDLYNALNARQKKFWSAFSPQGLAAIDYQLARPSRTNREETLAVKLLGAEALYRHFPYPLKNLTGNLAFDSGSIIVSDVISQQDRRKITLNGKAVIDSGDKPIYDILIDVNNVPLDATLKQALPEKQRYLSDQFDLTGLADGRINVSTSEQDSNSADYAADLSFKNASLRSNELPGLITDVSARAVFVPDSIDIKNFTGRYGQGQLSLTGRIWPGQQDRRPCYSLSAAVRQAELNEDLFALLPQVLKETIPQLQPKGKVNLSAELNRADGMARSAYEIVVDCLGDEINFKRFPYPLKVVTGTLTVTNDTIKFKDITATPADNIVMSTDTSAIKLNGQISLTDNAFNSAALQLSAKDIFFDERLGTALPQTSGAIYQNLSPAGTFDLDLENISVIKVNDGEKYIDLAGAARFKGCSFNVSAARAELDATLKTKASYKTGAGLYNGQSALSEGTFSVLDKSLTALTADICYDPNSRNWTTKKLVADCYGGKLTGRLEFKHSAGAALQYLLQVAFNDVNLRQFLSDTKPKQAPDTEHTSGKMSGTLTLNTDAGDGSSRIGICRAAITDMQVGRLSPLGKVLQVLSLTEPTDFAFNRMLIDSYIKSDRLFLRKLDLSGEALAFYGSGWMSLPGRNVDMVLIARGRRLATADPSILQSLAESLGQAVVQMEVTGDFYDPQVTTKAFPVIKQSLEIIGTRR